jgi:hypothetical protein
MTIANIHASCILLAGAADMFGAPADAGVLLLGESGAGKSSAALRLMARGARLVADDRVELFLRDGVLMGRPPKALAGLIEARGLGILQQPHAGEARLALAVCLAATAPRLPEPAFFAPPDELANAKPVPLVTLAAGDTALAETIVLAVAAHSGSLFRTEGNPN